MELERSQSKSEILDNFYRSLIRDLEIVDKDFEILLGSKALKVVANLSTQFFQKRAAQIINAFSDVLEIYREEFERIVLQRFTPLSPADKKLLEAEQQSFRTDLDAILKRLNIKAQILIEDLLVAQLQLNEETQTKLVEIQNITIDRVFALFRALKS